jgi:putative phosphoribosyl transferase
MRFRDRSDAGRQLAGSVAELDMSSPIVLALPRGGVPVAFEVAVALDAHLDVLVVRKIGAPGHPEFGIGAIAEGPSVVMDRVSVRACGVSSEAFDRLVEAETRELGRRVQHYRGERVLPDLDGRDVVLVDDGLATGVTAEAALRTVRGRNPHRLVLAVPVCAPETATRLRQVADEVVCVHEPTRFLAVGRFYEGFDQTTDEEVLAVLARAEARTGAGT